MGCTQFDIIKDITAEPFVQKYIDFFDIQTMAARLHNKESMSSEFKRRMDHGFFPWSFLIVMTKMENVTSALIANRDVTDEKLRELKQEELVKELFIPCA